ncbi:OmpP1/FadL family transporter [Qingshengfaniella alkalisoli]|uniref:Transporter n=1 Tax=Qingshengfaniella alkalisoli TaxID=2599296 RepID=A0A5B8I8E9_9RHOB|nr:outer membrane protein transport protein [Qingshengfaniella alkalisoli]QDY68936.1 transporter [Qingshengfaniella alkalisoli]
MKHLVTLAAMTVGGATATHAGGIDRSGQPLGVLFKEGNYLEFSVAHTNPDVSGEDLGQSPPGFPFPYSSGLSYDSVAGDYTSYGFGLKYDINDRFSVSVIGAEDFGADIKYPDEAGSLLGGTVANANTYAISVYGRYRIDDNWSVHAGLRADRADGNIKLNGLAYGGPLQVDPATGQTVGGGVSGYEVDLGERTDYGYAVGAAYEIPEIALRLAVTYFSSIEHEFKTTESFAVDVNGDGVPDATNSSRSAKTKVKTPQAVNIDFQTGVAENTLVFGGIRWAKWSEFKIAPELFEQATGGGLVDLEDSTTYTIGVGHRFNENFSGSASFIYEKPGDRLVSPLAPSTGLQAIALGGSYRIDQWEISGGVRYSWLGKAKAETGTPDVARAVFDDSTAVSVGMRVGYYF